MLWSKRINKRRAWIRRICFVHARACHWQFCRISYHSDLNKVQIFMFRDPATVTSTPGSVSNVTEATTTCTYNFIYYCSWASVSDTSFVTDGNYIDRQYFVAIAWYVPVVWRTERRASAVFIKLARNKVLDIGKRLLIHSLFTHSGFSWHHSATVFECNWHDQRRYFPCITTFREGSWGPALSSRYNWYRCL